MTDTADLNDNEDKIIYFTPTYAYDEYKKDGYVRVIIWIRDMKTSVNIQFKDLLPRLVRTPSNVEVDVVFENRSICVTIHGKSGDMKWRNFQLKVRQLLYDIVPEESYYEFQKQKIVLFMRKKEDLPWRPHEHLVLECADSDSSDEDNTIIKNEASGAVKVIKEGNEDEEEEEDEDEEDEDDEEEMINQLLALKASEEQEEVASEEEEDGPEDTDEAEDDD